jgi:hypothetical protein
MRPDSTLPELTLCPLLVPSLILSCKLRFGKGLEGQSLGTKVSLPGMHWRLLMDFGRLIEAVAIPPSGGTRAHH